MAQRILVRIALGTAIWLFLTLILFGIALGGIVKSGGEIPASLRVALGMPIVFPLLTLVLLAVAVRVWAKS